MDSTADEMIASVDATLANWRSAFESSPNKVRDADARGGDGAGTSSPSSPSPPTNNEAIKSPSSPPWKDPDAYHRRLSTFRPTTYFAKPLSLSPLVCAAFGWENTGKDIIKCLHPNCGATICIAFHPSLDEESRDKLSRTYLNMLVSCHNSACPFRTFSSRWSKTMHRCIAVAAPKQRSNNDDATKENNNLECLVNKVSRELKNDSKTEYYVPPYFLSLSDEFLRFEDCSDDGSITRNCIDECALQIREKLHVSSGKQKVEVSMPDEVTNFCREMYPDVDLDDILNHKGAGTKVPYLLSAFGWSIGEESVWDNNEGVIVKCNMCQARARLTWTGGDSSSKKRRRIDPSSKCANLKLIESHRVYCPYMCGFSSGPGQQPDLPGWKVVISNVLKSAAAQTCVESNS